jgi:hypothetical protein
MDGVDYINKRLQEDYGTGIVQYSVLAALDGRKNTIVGRDISVNLPTFRVVWSSSQTEIIYTEEEEFTESGLFLRKVCEVREQRKYSEELYFDKWILEQLQDAAGNVYLEKAGRKYSYEPRWVFGNANSDAQPIWKYVKMLADQCLLMNRVVKSPNDIVREEQEELFNERALIKTMIKNDSQFMSGGATLHNKDGIKADAVTVPHNYEKQNERVN